jgi:hypothetical protein
VSFPKLNSLQVFALLRVGVGLAFLFNQLMVQLPNFSSFYGNQGMINPSLFQFFSWSPLFLVWEHETLKLILLGIGVLFSLAFTVGLWARWVHLPMFILCLLFHLANPLVIHEPQQLSMLLLFLLFFVPYEGAFVQRRSRGFETYESMDAKTSSRVILCLQFFLGYYYFIAGAKKLPDPLWLSGEAVSVFIQSSYLGLDNSFSQLFTLPLLSKLASWSALIFELSFLPLILTPWRVWLIPVGVVFHGANIFMFDVGFFWLAMLIWYPTLLFKKDAKKSWAL